MAPPISSACNGCGEKFPSKNAMFRHLKETSGACLPKEEYADFLKYVVQQKREKVIVLYGYWIPLNAAIQDGEEVAQLLLKTIEAMDETSNSKAHAAAKVNRSYGYASRATNVVAQEKKTSAVSELLTTKLPPVIDIDSWLNSVNAAIEGISSQHGGVKIVVLGRQNMPVGKFNAEMDFTRRRVEYLLPAEFLLEAKSNLMRLFDSLPSFEDGVKSRNFSKENENSDAEMDQADVGYTKRPSEETLLLFSKLKKLMQSLTTKIILLDTSDAAAVFEKKFHDEKRHKNRTFHNNKGDKEKLAKIEYSRLLDDIADQDAPKKIKIRDEQTVPADGENEAGTTSDRKAKKSKRERREKVKGSKKKKDHVLKRKRYHNFTPTVMAHNFLSLRRLDRFYHRATLRFPGATGSGSSNESKESQRPFLVLSLSGDLFLSGQICRLVGLFCALASGAISKDIVECVFDENYPHLVPMPAAPSFAMYASDVMYMTMEGKAKAILTPRKTDRYEEGWNDDATLQRVQNWQTILREKVSEAWFEDGVDAKGRLQCEHNWTETVLLPWAERATKQLEEYRRWKAESCVQLDKRSNNVESVTNSIENPECVSKAVDDSMVAEVSVSPSPLAAVDSSVPEVYEKVLHFLRQADASGLWPSTTPKRQLVMVSNVLEKDKSICDGPNAKPFTSSLSIAHMKAQSNNEDRSSAYVFAEGEGGASGSFSVGAMPGVGCIQPKGNTLFPELMKSAFELELALCPTREPSSTIAVNRNAQFRPHCDSGAGAGQSTSLIVGLGTYSGGELMVEGEKIDIRYKPIEFNGWKQRHWTMPFQGERFSLVWFTPKGCEGVHGYKLSA